MKIEKSKKKFVKKVKRKIPWIDGLIEDYRDALDLNIIGKVKFRTSERSICIYCRGIRKLCGKPKCPIMMKFYSYINVKKLISNLELEGSSPPGVFIGRYGYPYVYAGPLIPPILGDTHLYDYPEKWIDMKMEDIIDFRFKLVRGKFLVNVKKFEEAGRRIQLTQELALATSPVETEAYFKKPPGKIFLIDADVQPMGPSAPLKKFDIINPKIDHKLEKAYYDFDLKAADAIINLFHERIPVTRIQRAFSVGAFGLRRNRKLVPTRWSITAVDSTISRRIRDEIVKKNPLINEYRVFESNMLGNRFTVIMFPEKWSYELIEAWYPGTAWNPNRRFISIGGDFEPYEGRKTYAKIGGCYYAARLATVEYLEREGRQASVLILREAYPEYILPLGVWLVRECVRKALASRPLKFDDLNEVLEHLSRRLKVNMKYWIDTSELLKRNLFQRRIIEYV